MARFVGKRMWTHLHFLQMRLKGMKFIVTLTVMLAVGCRVYPADAMLSLSPFCKNLKEIETMKCPPSSTFGGLCYCVDNYCVQNLEIETCQKLFDGTTLVQGTSTLADMDLSVYEHSNRHRSFPNTNITITSIKFSSLIYRLTVINTTEIGCYEFSVLNASTAIKEQPSLFWDCRWFKSKFSEFPMEFEYYATDHSKAEYRKFYFRLPKNYNIDANQIDGQGKELFIYYERHSQSVTFYWKKPSDLLNVSKYRVNLTECGDSFAQYLTFESFETNDSTKTFYEFPKPDTCFNIYVEPYIVMLGSGRWGQPSCSEPIKTGVSPDQTEIRLVLFVAFIILSVLFLLLCYLYFMKHYFYRSMKFHNTCLIVWVPTCAGHKTVVQNLQKLICSSSVDPSRPVVHIGPDFEVMQESDATHWWIKKFEKSDLIIVVSNPPVKNSKELYLVSKFAPLYEQGFVENTFSRFLTRGLQDKSKRFIRILLPHCKKTDFYAAARVLSCYHFFDDRVKICQALCGHSNLWLPEFLSWHWYSKIYPPNLWQEVIKSSECFVHDKHPPSVEDSVSEGERSIYSKKSAPDTVDEDEEATAIHESYYSSPNSSDSNSIDMESENPLIENESHCTEIVKVNNIKKDDVRSMRSSDNTQVDESLDEDNFEEAMAIIDRMLKLN